MMPENYQPPTLTVDNVIFQLIDNRLYVLLGTITSHPFYGEWALPGGFCSKDETTREAVDRVLSTKAGVQPERFGHIEQLYAFDVIVQDERGHVVSITYLGLGKNITPTVKNGAPCSTFHAYTDLPFIAYDQRPMIDFGVQRLKSLLETTNVMALLLPENFTLATLQAAYESVFQKKFDKPNFRKRFLSYDILQATEKFDTSRPHRPARFYQFKHQDLQPIYHKFADS
jgi:8-oxo-dGTP diphosphatase